MQTKKLYKSPDIDDIVRRYIRYLRLERSYSDNTLEAYRHDLNYLLCHLQSEGTDPVGVKLENLDQFAASLHEHGIGAKSQARILSGVRSFYRYLVLDGYIEVDPTELLVSPHLPKHLPEHRRGRSFRGCRRPLYERGAPQPRYY